MIKTYREHIFVKIVLVLIFLSPLFYNKSFYDGFTSFKVIVFSIGVAGLAFLFACKSQYWKLNPKFFKSAPFIFSILFLLGMGYSLFLVPDLIRDIYFQADILIAVYFLVLFKILKVNRVQNFLVYTSLLLLFVCVLIGVLQAVNVIPPYSEFFKITGPFLNPGPYACLVGVLLVMPIVILLLRKNFIGGRTLILASEKYEVFLVVLALFSIMVLVLSEVRAGLLSTIIVMFIAMFNKRYAENKAKFKRFVGFLVVGIIILIAAFAFLTKKDSSNGRLLIWKTALLNKPENIFIGNGYEYFERKYNTIQSEYFSSNFNPNAYSAKLAGNVSYAYNEFIEIYTNYGLIGLISVFAFIIYVGLNYYKNYHNKDLVFHLAFYVLLAIFIQGLISYPFSMLANKILFVTAFAIFCSYTSPLNTSSSNKYIPGILRLGLVTFVVFVLWNIYHSISAFKQWKVADDAHLIGDYKKSLILLNQQKDILSSNGSFLTYLGKELFLNEDIISSINVMEKAKSYSSDPIIFYTLGQCYSIMKKNAESDQNFNVAINISPNRLYPRYLLLKHYININDIDKAAMQAQIIISIDEKVKSKATDDIKKFAWSFLSGKKN